LPGAPSFPVFIADLDVQEVRWLPGALPGHYDTAQT
jgi:hypothetical protein